MIQWITYISVVGFIIMASIFLLDRKKKRNLTKVFSLRNASPTLQLRFNKVSQATYTRASKMPFLKGFLSRIRKRIETLAVYDEYSLRREVMKIVFAVASLILLITLILLMVRPGWLVVFWIFLGLLFLSGVLVDFFVHRVENRLLNQMKDFNNRVRYFYQQTKMVDEAFFDSIQFVGPEMKIQADKIYRILTSVEPEIELAKYEDVAPSRFLKVIAGLAVIVKDKGDVINENGSTFLRGLSSVNEELNTEILYRSKLTYKLRDLNVLALIPVFVALPIQNWSISQFPVMKTFYESRMGFLAEVLVYGISVLSYLLIRKMREINEAKYQSTMKRVKWEEWLLDKIAPLRVVINGITPPHFTKNYFKLKKLLKDANSPLKMEWFTLQRLLLTLTVFLVLAGGFLFAHERQKNSTLFTIVPASLFAGTITEEDYEFFKEQTAFDRSVIRNIESMEGLTPETLQAYIATQMGLDETDPQVKVAYDRVVDKWTIVKNSYLRWWEVLIALLLAAAAWYTPVWILRFQSFLRYKDMENEVHQYLVLVGILKEFDHMSVYTILEWLERFGVIFKEPILQTLQVYDAGPESALDQLSEAVSFEPFNQIIERLKLAIVRISIKESFDDIEMERNYYMEQRREANQRSIEEKGSWANMLGMLPTVAVTFLYLVGPLIYLSVIESQDMLTRIQ